MASSCEKTLRNTLFKAYWTHPHSKKMADLQSLKEWPGAEFISVRPTTSESVLSVPLGDGIRCELDSWGTWTVSR